MSLLTIAQAVMDECNLARAATVVANPDPEVQKILRFANRIGADLVARGTWQALRARVDYVTSSTVAQEVSDEGDELLLETGGPLLLEGSPSESPIPPDMARMVPETFWDVTNGRLIVGPTSPVDWSSMLAKRYSGSRRYWTRRGNILYVYPAFGGGETASFEYYSRNFCENADGTATYDTWQADTNVARLPEELFVLGIVALVTETEGDVRAPAARAAYELRLRDEGRGDIPKTRVMSAGDIFGQARHSGGAPAADGSWL